MPTYCAFLGHQPHISLAELCVLLPDMRLRKLWNQHIMTFEVRGALDQEWLKHVGGIVLLAQERTSVQAPTVRGRHGGDDAARLNDAAGQAALERLVHPLLQKELAEGKRKVTFSFRCFGIPRNIIRSLYRSSKAFLRSKGIPSRYIGSERHPAKPGTLPLRGIPGPGCSELVILRDERSQDLWIGATCAVQDIEAYTERDVGKPYRDMRTGLLPPKLAQIMLNLGLLALNRSFVTGAGLTSSQTKNQKQETKNLWGGVTVWDPFCGSGVIVLEALLRRAHILASDRSERALRGCEQNIRWLRSREKIPKAVTHAVFKQNALKPPLAPLAHSFDKLPPSLGFGRAGRTSSAMSGGRTIVVTETSLGPPLTHPLTKAEIRQLLRSAEELEEKFFGNLASFLPHAPVVATFPVYIARDGTQHFLPTVLQTLARLGYRLTFPGNKAIRMTDRHTLLYLRPDQCIGREIVCLLPPRKR